MDDVADAELLKSFELSRQKYKKRKEQVGAGHYKLSTNIFIVVWGELFSRQMLV